jgi:hypothetical protein
MRRARTRRGRNIRTVPLSRFEKLTDTLQAVERLASVLVLPHPDAQSAEVRRLRPDFETEATAMRFVMEHEQSLRR